MKPIGKKDYFISRIRVWKGAEQREYTPGELYWTLPVVRAVAGDVHADAELVVGSHALSAALHAGKERVTCRTIECSEPEFAFYRTLDVLANKHLVGSPNENALAALEALTARSKSYDMRLLNSGRAGRPFTAKGLIRALLATQRGVHHSALYMAGKRRQKLSEKGVAHVAKTTEAIESFGLELSEDFALEVQNIQAALYQAEGFTTSIRRTIKALRERDFPAVRLNELEQLAVNLGKMLAGARPASVCPYCKGVDSIQQGCGNCLGTGWASKEMNRRTDARLLKTGEHAVVMAEGKLVPLDEYLGTPEEEAPATVVEPQGFTDDPYAFKCPACGNMNSGAWLLNNGASCALCGSFVPDNPHATPPPDSDDLGGW